MAHKKALLTLLGGRSFLPTALALLHEKPDVVVAISSKESYRNLLPQLKQAIATYQKKHQFSCVLESPDGVDAFDISEIQRVCESAIAQHPEMDWLCEVTSATSLMTLSGYEAAKLYGGKSENAVRCWYLGTAQNRVIPLVGEGCSEDVFKIDVDDYATAYGRNVVAGKLEDQRQRSEQLWLPFAQKLGKNPQFATLMKIVMSKIGNRPAKGKPRLYTMQDLPMGTYSLLEEAQQAGLLSQLNRNSGTTISFELSYMQDQFLNGAWLEAYVWDAARTIWDGTRGKLLFDDCQWDQKFIDGKSENELDVAITYKAQLIIAECKTGETDSFKSENLNKLDSVANFLGGRFVGKLLVSSLSDKKPSSEFLAQAHSRKIVVVTGETLPEIATILKQEAVNPTFSRE